MHVVGSHQRGQEKPKEEQRHKDHSRSKKKIDQEEDVTQDRPTERGSEWKNDLQIKKISHGNI
jgi:hypothetical protein